MPAPQRPRLEWLLWAALGIALSPVLVDRARWLAVDGNPYGSILVAPFLIALLWWRERALSPAAPRRLAGGALIGVGLACQTLGLLSRTAGLAALAIPTCVVGLSCFVGRPRVAIAMLGLWMIPIPDALLEWATPGPETRLLGWAAAPWLGLGLPIELAGPVAHCGGTRLELTGYDVGAPLALFGAGLGLFAALCRDVDRGSGRLRAMALGALGLALVQPVAVSLAVGSLCLGDLGEGARRALSTGPWLLAALLTIALFWRPEAPEDVAGRP